MTLWRELDTVLREFDAGETPDEFRVRGLLASARAAVEMLNDATAGKVELDDSTVTLTFDVDCSAAAWFGSLWELL
jgi:hypothetical protein